MKSSPEKYMVPASTTEKRRRPPPPISVPPTKILAAVVPWRGKSSRHGDSASESSSVAHTNRSFVDESKAFAKNDEIGSDADENEDEKGGRKAEKGCRCGRTKCLKQYCACFRTDQRCTSDCVCQDCRNDGLHEVERLLAIRHVRMHSNTAFKGTSLAANDQQVVTPRGSVKILRGCRCKKSRCQKKVWHSFAVPFCSVLTEIFQYCECFGVGLPCTTSCVCVDCINGNESSRQFEMLASMQSQDANSPDDAKEETSSVDRPRRRWGSDSSGEESEESGQEYASSDSDDENPAESSPSPREGGDAKRTRLAEKADPKALTQAERASSKPPPPSSAVEADEDGAEYEDLPTPGCECAGGADRRATPVQSRTGWETDENGESSAVFDAPLSLGPPTFSPRSRLRWASFEGHGVGGGAACHTPMSFNPQSPCGGMLNRETSGNVLRPCTAQPCSPIGDAVLSWDGGFHTSGSAGYAFE
mmetsp:Transcript_76414/g.205679  ORF Transcript_76414/g.205679 Transcript_76414/m.205679 type:complete len:475 (-) Transcript_76414:513-1937(-)